MPTIYVYYVNIYNLIKLYFFLDYLVTLRTYITIIDGYKIHYIAIHFNINVTSKCVCLEFKLGGNGKMTHIVNHKIVQMHFNWKMIYDAVLSMACNSKHQLPTAAILSSPGHFNQRI